MVTIFLALPAIAQSAGQGHSLDCTAQVAAVEHDMEVARSKGQMLRRKQLAEELAALQASCEPVRAEQSRASNIERLEQEIRDLQSALKQAEAELRKLRSESR